jgi:DNA-binding transcriptional LysR family regulator
MTVDLNAVATFVRVVDRGGFTSAAAALGVPKSSVSRSVKRLEQELGVRLLQRTTRRLSLTEAGRAYYERVSSSLAGMDEARAAIGLMQDAPRGVVRVTAPPDIGAILLAPIVARFVRKFPEVRAELSLTSRYVDLVQEGFDLALRMGKLSDSTLVARSLGSIDAGLYASKAYLARSGTPKKLADLEKHTCVLFRATNGRIRWQLEGPRGPESVEVSGPIVADDMTFLREAILAGGGIGFMPAPNLRGANLVRVLPEYGMHGVPAHIVYPSARYVPQRVALLRDAFVEEIPRECFFVGKKKKDKS